MSGRRELSLLSCLGLVLVCPVAGRAAAPPDKPALTDCYGDPLPPGAVARVGTDRFLTARGVDQLAFTADGKALLSVDRKGRVIWWDAATGRERKRVAVRNRHPMAFSADGKWLVGADDNSFGPRSSQSYFLPGERPSPKFALRESHRIGLWSTEHGDAVLWLDGHESIIQRLALSRDGRRLASVSRDGTVITWDVAQGKELRRWALTGRGRPTALALSPDGKLLAWAVVGRVETSAKVHLLDPVSGRLVGALEGPSVESLAFSPDGRLLAVGEFHHNVRLVDVARRRFVRDLGEHTHSVTALCFSPDGKHLASASADGGAKLWNVPLGRERCRLTEPRSGLVSFASRRTGRRLPWESMGACGSGRP
jgi:WD40 repeat protein